MRDVPFRFALSEPTWTEILGQSNALIQEPSLVTLGYSCTVELSTFLGAYFKSIPWSSHFSATVVVSIVVSQVKSVTSARACFEKDDSFQRKATMGLPIDDMFYGTVGN